MKPNEKRTSTQPGLGKVTADARHTTKRTRFVVDPDAPPASAPPISAPPPSGGPISGTPSARQARALEKARTADAERAVDRTPSPPPGTVRSDTRPPHEERIERIERVELDGGRSPASVRGAPSSRTPIDVTQVDTTRLPRTAAPSKSSEGRFPAEEPTGRRPIAGRVRSDDRADPSADTSQSGSRTVDGRPIGKRADSKSPESGGRPESGARRESGSPVSGRPVSGRPDSRRAGSGRPTAGRPASIRPPPGRSSASPAPVFTKSARPLVREDNFGDAVKADAVQGSGRAVPKLLKNKAEIAAAPIDHRAGFVLAHVDGVTTVQGLVDICGMSEDEVNEILDRLRRLGIAAVR